MKISINKLGLFSSRPSTIRCTDLEVPGQKAQMIYDISWGHKFSTLLYLCGQMVPDPEAIREYLASFA